MIDGMVWVDLLALAIGVAGVWYGVYAHKKAAFANTIAPKIDALTTQAADSGKNLNVRFDAIDRALAQCVRNTAGATPTPTAATSADALAKLDGRIAAAKAKRTAADGEIVSLEALRAQVEQAHKVLQEAEKGVT